MKTFLPVKKICLLLILLSGTGSAVVFAQLSSSQKGTAVLSKEFLLRQGENVADKISKNIFIKLEVNKTTCYTGEAILVTYKLFTRLQSQSNLLKTPAFNGFSVVDLLQSDNTNFTTEKMDGREYNVYILRKSQLYPLQAGDMELESVEVENNIQFVKEAFVQSHPEITTAMLNDLLPANIPPEALQNEKITLKSKPILIHVNSLPEAGKPVLFKGAVGSFAIDAGLDKNNFSTDEIATLKVSISGNGNLTLVNSPDIFWPKGLEFFDQQANEQLDKESVPLKGSKIFDHPFTVAAPGNYTLASIEFSYFDPREQKYIHLFTKPLSFTVTRGTGKTTIPIAFNQKTKKEQFFDTLFTNRLWIIIPVALLILSGLFIWVIKENLKEKKPVAVKDTVPEEKEAEPPVPISTHPLKAAEEKLVLQDSRGFYQSLNQELKQFLALRLQLDVGTINKKKITEAIDKKGLPVSTALLIQQLMDDIEWQLYTPFTQEDKMMDIYQRANEVIHSFPHKGN